MVKWWNWWKYFDPIYQNGHEFSLWNISNISAILRLNWFEGCQIQTALIFIIVNTRVVILILDLINEVRNRLENQQKSWLKYYLSNISWAISKRGVHILILHFQEVGWLVGIFQTYQFEGDFNGAAFCNFKQNSIHKLILTDVSMR